MVQFDVSGIASEWEQNLGIKVSYSSVQQVAISNSFLFPSLPDYRKTNEASSWWLSLLV